jgi:hypothetical protein
MAKANYDAAKSSYDLTLVAKRKAIENADETKAAQKEVADAIKALADARAAVKAELAKNPEYQTLLQKEKAAQNKVDALRQAKARQEEITAAAGEVMRIGGLISAMVRQAEQAQPAVAEATQRVTAANDALAAVKKSSDFALKTDPDLDALNQKYHAAADTLKGLVHVAEVNAQRENDKRAANHSLDPQR